MAVTSFFLSTITACNTVTDYGLCAGSEDGPTSDIKASSSFDEARSEREGGTSHSRGSKRR